jgi:hypothetical protein
MVKFISAWKRRTIFKGFIVCRKTSALGRVEVTTRQLKCVERNLRTTDTRRACYLQHRQAIRRQRDDVHSLRMFVPPVPVSGNRDRAPRILRPDAEVRTTLTPSHEAQAA